MSERKKSSRILAFDLLRGFFLVAILFDHLQFFPNGLDWLTGRGQMYVSAAEGFFLISGVVLGIVRGRKLIEKPFRLVATLLLKRGVQIYITAIVLFFIFTFIGWLFIDNPGIKPGIRSMDENFFEIVRNALTFQYIYGWADYLRLYAVYLLVSPLVMWLLRKGLWYVVLIGSFYVWTLFDGSQLETTELSQVYSWQLLFFGGMTIGFYFEPMRAWWNRRSLSLRRAIIAAIVPLAVGTMILNVAFVIFGDAIFGMGTVEAADLAMQPYFSKERLPLERIALFLVWFSAAFWFFHKYEPTIIRWFGKLLLPFGTNSLYVYTIEAFVIYIIHLFVAQATDNLVINLALTLFCLALVWFAVKRKFLMKIIPR